MNIIFIYLVVYFAILAYITWSSSRKQTGADFLNSSKDLSAWESTWTTFASLLTGYNFVLGVTFAFLYGFWYLMAFVGAGFSFIALYWIYKRRFLFLKGQNLFSVGDYFAVRYGVFSKVFVNALLVFALVLFLILQIFVNTQLFSGLLGVSKELGLLLIVGTVCAYLWFGGFKTSVRTDIFQGVLMLPIILAVFFVPFNFSYENLPIVFDLNQLGFAIGLALLQFLSLLAQPESFQRVFASRDTLSLKRGLITAFILIIFIAGPIAYLGINFKMSGTAINPTSLFTEGVLSVLPYWLSSLLSISLIAAFMGTIDSSAFALGILSAKLTGSSSERLVVRTKYFIVAGIVLSAFCSLYLFSFLSSVFALISLISIVGVALLLSVLFELQTRDINIFLVTGSATYVLGLIFKFVTDNPLTSLVPSAVGIGVLLLSVAWRRTY